MKKLLLSFLLLLLTVPCFSVTNFADGIILEKFSRNSQNHPKIAVVSVIINEETHTKRDKKKVSYKDIVSFGTRSKRVYCETHGYDFIIAEKRLTSCYDLPQKRELEPAWTKLGLISRVLENYDWVFLTDADSIILNFDIKLEQFIDNSYDIIACTESESLLEPETYNVESYINTGQVFYKNSEVTKAIIIGAWNRHETFTKNSWEQARINYVISHEGYMNNVKVHPPKHFNLKPSLYEEGDFLVHMYSYHNQRLYRVMKKFKKEYGHLVKKAEKRLKKSQERK